MTSMRRKIIQELARQKLIEYDCMSLPISPKDFAQTKLDITVHSFDPPVPSVSGFLMQKGNNFGIGYSKAIKSKGFQNFTVAHELGHYFIDGHVMALLDNGIHKSCSGYISKNIYEQEADAFATEFLMPWKLISPLIQHQTPGFSVIKSISKECESSLLAAAIRYTAVAKDCVAVVVSHEGVIEFMTASDSFRRIPSVADNWLRRDSILPQQVPSAKLGFNYSWITQCEVIEEGCQLCDWFSGAPTLDVEEDIIGLGSYGRLLTVLIAHWDEEDMDEDDESGDSYIDRWQDGYFRKR